MCGICGTGYHRQSVLEAYRERRQNKLATRHRNKRHRKARAATQRGRREALGHVKTRLDGEPDGY